MQANPVCSIPTATVAGAKENRYVMWAPCVAT